MRGIKATNGYAQALGSLYVAAPKAVIAAVLVSVLTSGGQDAERAAPLLLEEWQALYENGIVPQKPPTA